MASSSQSAIPDAVDPSTEAENMPSKSVKGSDNANMSDPQPNANQKISNSTTEAENKDVDGSENANKLGQQSAIPDVVDPSTKAENMPSKNVKGSDNANMSDPQPNAIQKLSNSTTEAENKDVDGSQNANKLGQQPSDNQKISNSTTEAENKDVDGSKNANKLGQQTVNQEKSESTILAHVDRRSAGAENDKGFENAKMLELQQLTIPELVDRISTEAKKLLPEMSDDLKKLIAGLNEIREFFMNSGDNTAGGAQVKTVSARIVHEPPYRLGTDDGKEVASQVVQLKAKLGELNEIVSKLKLQPTVNQEISESIIRDTEAENLLHQMDGHLKKLIAGVKETREFFTNSGHKTAGAFVKTVLEWILLEPSYGLRTDDGQEVALPRAKALEAKLDELNWIVSKLKLQLPLDSVSTASPTVSKINETIIPAVVARLEIANMYSLCLCEQPPEKDDSNSGKKGGSTGEQVHKLRNDLSYIRSFLKNLEDNSNNLGRRLDNFKGANAGVFVDALLQHSAFDDLGTDREAKAKQLQAKLGVLKKVVIKLKHQISSPNKLSPTDSDDRWYNQVSSEFDYSQALDIMPVLHVHNRFKTSSAFQDFREVYQSLELTTKLCLLCFATIPENEVVKKRFMTHWWVGEAFVSPPPGKTYEEAADGIFQELVKKNCIEPFNQKLRYVVDSYKMDPCIRSAVIVLAKEAGFFDFDGDKWNPSVNFKSSNRACLVDGFSQELLKIKNELDPAMKIKIKNELDPAMKIKIKNELLDPEMKIKIKNEFLDPEKLQVIFNVNEPYPDVFELEWFSKLKNVKVLYLGRWQTSAKHHIEVESVEFLNGLTSMKLLRFFSLQGISRITKLPDSVCKLLNLRILDLRACHNLEVLPNGIGSLNKLTHLDISECYLLDYMPKGISFLLELQVLKGFVISGNSSSKSCTINDLSKLKNLGKLSIYTNKEAFPETEDVTTLEKFKVLQKLTITWGAGAFQPKADNNAKEDKGAPQSKAATTTNPKKVGGKKTQDVGVAKETAATIVLFKTLEKLDLKCYPLRTAPSWLLPGNFSKLKKLYIRGGNLQNICPVQENVKWSNVEVLRLKFLSELNMDYKKLRSSFPKLTYFEKFKCPKLTYFPCNENGVVWLGH